MSCCAFHCALLTQFKSSRSKAAWTCLGLPTEVFVLSGVRSWQQPGAVGIGRWQPYQRAARWRTKTVRSVLCLDTTRHSMRFSSEYTAAAEWAVSDAVHAVDGVWWCTESRTRQIAYWQVYDDRLHQLWRQCRLVGRRKLSMFLHVEFDAWLYLTWRAQKRINKLLLQN